MNKIKNILTTYVINESTCALIPTKSVEHQTKVIEEHHIYYVNQSPIEIIKFNCLLNGSDFNGRRLSIKYHLGFSRKCPIAISKTIHAFPTHAIADFDCIWLFSSKINKIISKNKASKIIFNNKYKLIVPVSNYILTKQHFRCFAVNNLYKTI